MFIIFPLAGSQGGVEPLVASSVSQVFSWPLAFTQSSVVKAVAIATAARNWDVRMGARSITEARVFFYPLNSTSSEETVNVSFLAVGK